MNDTKIKLAIGAIKKLIKKVKDFWYSPEGTITMAIAAIISTLTAMFIGPVTVFTYIGAVIVITLGGGIYIIQIAQENEED